MGKANPYQSPEETHRPEHHCPGSGHRLAVDAMLLLGCMALGASLAWIKHAPTTDRYETFGCLAEGAFCGCLAFVGVRLLIGLVVQLVRIRQLRRAEPDHA